MQSDVENTAERRPHGRHPPPEINQRLRTLMIAALATALATGLAGLLRIVIPRQAWDLLTPVAFLIALEALLTTRWLAHPDRRHVNHAAYRISELIAIGLALRLLTWALTGGWPDLATLRGYLLAPLSFFDAALVGYILCGLVAWERSVRFGALFSRLDLGPGELSFYSLSRSEQDERAHERPPTRQRSYAFEELVKSWLMGGFVLGLVAALTTIDLPTLNFNEGIRNVSRLGLRPEMLWALIIYFVPGLWLISQARLSMIRARWLLDGLPARSGVFANWRRSSLLLLFVVALVAAFLPIGSTFAAAAILQTLLSALAAVIQGLVVVATLLFLLLASFLGVPQAQEELPAPPPATPPALAPPDASPLSETTAILAGSVFWLVVAIVASIGVFFFLRDRGYAPALAPLLHWWRDVKEWLREWMHGVSQRTGDVRDAVRRRLTLVRGSGQARRRPWRFIRVNSLPPREQIQYFYLSTVRRAGEKGAPRSKSETPSEYSKALQEEWPEASEEIETLTGAFLQARYSEHDIEREDVNPVKRVWKRVRASLRHGRRSSE